MQNDYSSARDFIYGLGIIIHCSLARAQLWAGAVRCSLQAVPFPVTFRQQKETLLCLVTMLDLTALHGRGHKNTVFQTGCPVFRTHAGLRKKRLTTNRVKWVVFRETVVLRRCERCTLKFGFINGVDNVRWPPYRDYNSWHFYRSSTIQFKLDNLRYEPLNV